MLTEFTISIYFILILKFVCSVRWSNIIDHIYVDWALISIFSVQLFHKPTPNFYSDDKKATVPPYS